MEGGIEMEVVKFWVTKQNCKIIFLFIVNSKIEFFRKLYWELIINILFIYIYHITSRQSFLTNNMYNGIKFSMLSEIFCLKVKESN